MKKSKIRFYPKTIFILVFFFTFGCFMMASTPPSPGSIIPPKPRKDNKGAFMCPYTQDGVLTKWVDKAINAKIGAAAGQAAGGYAGDKATENVPVIGGLIGGKVGEKAGRTAAIEASGGIKYIQKTSDMSFDKVDDLAIYLYAKHSSHAHYADGLDAAMEIYPKLKKRYHKALKSAKTK